MTDTMLQPHLCIDFDGTICEHQYPKIGALKPGAKAALDLFKSLGYKITIYTCRTCHHHYDVFGGDPSQPTLERQHVLEMIQYLKDNQIPYDEIDDGSKGKPLADAYIDDRGIEFKDNWPQIAARIYNETVSKNYTKGA